MTTIGDIVHDRIDPDAIERRRVRKEAERWLEMWTGVHDLPPGVRGDSTACVFANALGGEFGAKDWSVPEDRLAHRLGYEHIDLPADVREFIRRFDAGEYPDLVGGGRDD